MALLLQSILSPGQPASSPPVIADCADTGLRRSPSLFDSTMIVSGLFTIAAAQSIRSGH
jgi:hypothetical protein